MCYNTVSTYDTIIVSLNINCSDTPAFCMHKMHDTIYDIIIMASLNLSQLAVALVLLLHQICSLNQYGGSTISSLFIN
jgi:hypothetical protein